MYLKSDLASVPISKFKLNSKAKATILNNFPTTTVVDDVDGPVEVFSTMEVGRNEHASNLTPSTVKVLKLLGTSKEAMESQDWTGVKKAYFRFKYALPENSVIEKSSIYDEIFRHTDAGVECTAQFTYISHDILTPASAIKADFDAGINLDKYGYLETEGDDQNWYIAYADIGQQAFDRSVSVKAAKLEKDPIDGRVTYTTNIVMTYTRKEVVEPAIDMDSCLVRVKSNGVYDDDFLDNYFVASTDSIYATVTVGETIEQTIDTSGNIVYRTVYKKKKYLRVDKVRAMKLKTFVSIIKATLSFKYKLKPVEWWQKVVAVAIVVLVIIVAAVVTIATGGLGTGAAWYVVVGTIATAVSITATVVSVALSLYMNELAKNGYVGQMGVFKNAVVIAQDIAKYAGYVALLTGIAASIQTGFTTTSVNASGQVVTVPMSTSAIMAKVSQWLSSFTNIYLEYASNESNSKLQKEQDELSAQQELIDDYSSPKAIVAIQKDFDTYAFLDLNAKMDSIPYKMTQGLIDTSTTKYYD